MRRRSSSAFGGKAQEMETTSNTAIRTAQMSWLLPLIGLILFVIARMAKVTFPLASTEMALLIIGTGAGICLPQIGLGLSLGCLLTGRHVNMDKFRRHACAGFLASITLILGMICLMLNPL